MNMIKKVMSGIVTGTMALGLMAPLAYASKLPTDVQGTKYEESVELLQALKIMVGDAETGNFRLEDNIIRSEVAKISTGLAGLMDVAEANSNPTSFPDVVSNHWANGYINVANSQKYVIGDDVGTFRPDANIKFSEAVAILVRVLGYEPSAQANGGYPNGYLVVAAQNGLLSGGIAKGPDDLATRGDIAQMAFNALTINLMERTGYGTDEEYKVVDKTLLEDKLDVVKAYGQVVGNNETTLEGASSLKDDEVSIKTDDSTDVYKIAETDAKDFLAQSVIYYYNEDSSTSDKNLVLVRGNKSKNDIVTVSSSNIDSITGTDKKTLAYWVNKETDSKTEKAVISSTAKTFYNGVAKTYDLTQLPDLASGNVKLLDTDRNGEFDYVFVTEYRNIVVDDVSATTYRINDKYNQLSLTLDPSDKNLKYSITMDGQAIELKDLKEWDILSVAMDGATQAESKVVNVLVSRNTVTGKVTEISDDKRMIDGKLYEIAQNYTDANLPEIKLNDEGTYYLDVDGKIAAVDTATTAGENYAYLAETNVVTGLSDTLELKVFTKDGETTVLNGADKIRVNGSTGMTPTDAEAAIKAANSGTAAQMITYDTNSSGLVTAVTTANMAATGYPNKNDFSKDYASESGSLTYSSSSQKLGRFNVDADTIVFDIPKTSTDTDDYAVRSMSMFVDKSSYEVDVYDLSESMTAKIIVVKDSAGDTNAESAAAVVTRVSATQNADQVNVDKLYAIQDGKTVELMAKDTDTLVKTSGTTTKKLEAGDVVQFRTNAKNEIEKVTVLFDSASRNNTTSDVLKDYEGTEMTTVLGNVTKKFSTSINVTAGGMDETNFNIANAKIYKYDYSKTSGLQVTATDASEIIKYDAADPYKVFLRIYKGEVKEVVIIRVQQ